MSELGFQRGMPVKPFHFRWIKKWGGVSASNPVECKRVENAL